MEMEMKKLGFGTMRLPVLNQEDPAAVDLEQLQLNYIDWDSPNIQSRPVSYTHLTLPTILLV